ncbi:MAG: bacillithiol biosynthesis deacetylase BshB1 [Bacteroidia bacterium]|nr:bacillithiol biosynthesis deacetylase BshB1 [Bacteroidia bacterium]
MTGTVDVLAFSPHPDDAELYCSGTLLLLKDKGFRTAIADLTLGELSTRGTLESRAAETAEATRLLQLDARVNLRLPDGAIANTEEQRIEIIRVLRTLRPRTVFLPYPEDRHPDHVHASALVKDALFLSGLVKLRTQDVEGNEQTAWRPPAAYYYMLTRDFEPTIIVDVSAAQERKLAAIRAYATQFFTGAGDDGTQTYISTPEFLHGLLGRSQRLGFLVGGQYGEGFLPLQPRRFEAEWLLS